MLKKHHYSKWAMSKVLLVLPLIMLLLMLNCKNQPKEPQAIKYDIAFENMPSESGEEVTYEIDITQGEDNVQKINVKKVDDPLREID